MGIIYFSEQNKTFINNNNNNIIPRNIMIVTKTIPFYQSDIISNSIWKSHHEANYCYNMGIQWRLKENLTQFDVFNKFTKINQTTPWLNNKVWMNHYSLDQGRKAVNLFYASNKKKLDKIKWNEKNNIMNNSIKLTNPKTLFRRKNINKKQPTFGSFGKPTLKERWFLEVGKNL